ncbi:MAG: hypothetical protein J6C62_06150 [Clostridia bacterium]|nr:hypothetical protein [Clostridia bacterium]
MAQIIEELYGEIISIESTGRKSNAEWEWRKSYIGFRGRIVICMDEIKPDKRFLYVEDKDKYLITSLGDIKEEDGIITLATKNSIYKICVNKKKREMMKGVPYKGFFETLKIYRKLHFQAVKRKLELGYIVQVLFLAKNY